MGRQTIAHNNTIVLFADPTVIMPAYCTVASVVRHLPPDTNVTVFGIDFEAQTLADLVPAFRSLHPSVELLPIASDDTFGSAIWTTKYGGKATWGRLFLDQLLPDCLDRVLYLDCDMLVCRPLQDLFGSSLHGHAVGACDDAAPYLSDITGEFRTRIGLDADGRYLNSGLLLLDWQKLLQEDILGKARSALNGLDVTTELPFADQDILIIVIDGNWQRLDPRWNLQRVSLLESNSHQPWIAHFTGPRKPWKASCHDQLSEYIKQYIAIYEAQPSLARYWPAALPSRTGLLARRIWRSTKRHAMYHLARAMPWLFRPDVKQRIGERYHGNDAKSAVFNELIKNAQASSCPSTRR